MKKGTLIAQPGKPLEFRDATDFAENSDEERQGVGRVGAAMAAYRKAAKQLLAGKYACYADVVPGHLRGGCDVCVLQCSDGILVRYDRASSDQPVMRVGTMEASLSEMAPKLSEFMIRIGEIPPNLSPEQLGPKLLLKLQNVAGHTVDLGGLHPIVLVHLRLPDEIPKPPARPFRLVALPKDFVFEFGGVILPPNSGEQSGSSTHQNFLAVAQLPLPVGWEGIEIYPLLGDEYWDPAYAAMWAEFDILAIAAERNLREKKLTDLDPASETRRRYGNLLAELERLLQGPEEPLHQFLREHPELLCPTCVQHWSKVPFGGTKSDFVFREPPNDYELVEIEAPNRQLFRQDGQQHSDLTHAINQTTDWVRYIEDNKRTVEQELGLQGISTNPRRRVVIGRSSSLTDENRRKVTTLQNDHPKLCIQTYDDVLASCRANLERILGPLTLTGGDFKVYFFGQQQTQSQPPPS